MMHSNLYLTYLSSVWLQCSLCSLLTLLFIFKNYYSFRLMELYYLCMRHSDLYPCVKYLSAQLGINPQRHYKTLYSTIRDKFRSVENIFLIDTNLFNKDDIFWSNFNIFFVDKKNSPITYIEIFSIISYFTEMYLGINTPRRIFIV